MTIVDTQYEDLLQDILDNGVAKADRTGTGTISVFGRQLRYDLSKGFPLVTTKKVNTRAITGELFWFLNGDTNTKWLNDNNIRIWDAWADKNGDLGPVYGAQWRAWGDKDGGKIDQVLEALELVKNDPDSRRIIVSSWNVGELEEMALMPCHNFYQLYVADGKLSLMFNMRSADVPVGVPFNIASYAILTHMFAQQAGLEVGDLVYNAGDAHIYLNQIEQVKEQLSREAYPFPTLELTKAKDMFSYDFDDVKIKDYKHHPFLKMPVAV